MMHSHRTAVVTGAFGFSGSYIARRLLACGDTVRTLTNQPRPLSAFADSIVRFPLDFRSPQAMADAICGADVLFNTYWVRFPHSGMDHSQAVRNTGVLLESAKAAGIRKVIHVSITNPSAQSRLSYFRGKAEIEAMLQNSGLGWAILRPAVLFGYEDILINNIAWLLRRFPLFAIPGDGRYSLQPIFVEDFAQLAVDLADRTDNVVLDAVGPETFTYEDLVRCIGRAIGRERRIVHLPPQVVLGLARTLSVALGDVLLTRDEIAGLMENLLISRQPPTGTTRLSEWLLQNADEVGMRYANELARHYRRN